MRGLEKTSRGLIRITIFQPMLKIALESTQAKLVILLLCPFDRMSGLGGDLDRLARRTFLFDQFGTRDEIFIRYTVPTAVFPEINVITISQCGLKRRKKKLQTIMIDIKSLHLYFVKKKKENICLTFFSSNLRTQNLSTASRCLSSVVLMKCVYPTSN